jgi:hypothetical protein
MMDLNDENEVDHLLVVLCLLVLFSLICLFLSAMSVATLRCCGVVGDALPYGGTGLPGAAESDYRQE